MFLVGIIGAMVLAIPARTRPEPVQDIPPKVRTAVAANCEHDGQSCAQYNYPYGKPCSCPCAGCLVYAN